MLILVFLVVIFFCIIYSLYGHILGNVIKHKKGDSMVDCGSDTLWSESVEEHACSKVLIHSGCSLDEILVIVVTFCVLHVCFYDVKRVYLRIYVTLNKMLSQVILIIS